MAGRGVITPAADVSFEACMWIYEALRTPQLVLFAVSVSLFFAATKLILY
jgi:hypothetical protein